MSAENSNKPFGDDGWTIESLGSLAGKSYAVTGANSGTGYETARAFLSKGARVFMLNRSRAKSEEAMATLAAEFPAAQCELIEMDLESLDSVRAAAVALLARLQAQSASLDGLICNAAIAQVPAQRITAHGFESQLGVNHFGHFLLCALLYDAVAASGGRFVHVGSGGYKMIDGIQFDDLNFDRNYGANQAYCQSKLAQMMFGYELQRRIERSGGAAQSRVCHPGASRTQLIANASWLTRISWWLLSTFAQSAERGAWPAVLCATEPALKADALYGPTQRWETVGAIGECAIKPHVLDEEAAAKLWALSEEKVGQKFVV